MHNQNMKFETIDEWILNSTNLSAIKLVKSKYIIGKLLWVSYMVTSYSLCLYMTIGLINSYNYNNTVSSIQTIYEQPQQFPVITFCSNDFENYSLNETIKHCRFSSDNSCYKKPDNYFERLNHKCYLFNSGMSADGPMAIYNSTIGGFDDCFSLKVFTSSILKVWIKNKSFRFSSITRIKNNYESNFQEIQSGSTVHMILDKVVEEKLEEPYNMCIKDVSKFKRNKTLINFINNLNMDYEEQICFDLCFELFYLETNKCNCKNSSLGNIWTNCYNKDNLTDDCLESAKFRFYNQRILEICHDYCPQKCDTITYIAIPNFLPALNSINQSAIRIYFRSLKYTLITQKLRMNLYDLVANIGSIFSLFLGLSFISLFEVFDLIIEIIYKFTIFIKKKK